MDTHQQIQNEKRIREMISPISGPDTDHELDRVLDRRRVNAMRTAETVLIMLQEMGRVKNGQ